MIKKLLLSLLSVICITSCCHKEPAFKDVEANKNEVTQMYNEVKIHFKDGAHLDYKAQSCHTNWNTDEGGLPPDGNIHLKAGERCLWDHSGTAVGYYGSKSDYQEVEKGCHQYVAYDSYGHNGNCVIVFKANAVDYFEVIE